MKSARLRRKAHHFEHKKGMLKSVGELQKLAVEETEIDSTRFQLRHGEKSLLTQRTTNAAEQTRQNCRYVFKQ